MANTITQRTLSSGSNTVIRHIHIISDGTEETDTVIFDNSAFFADISSGKVEQVWCSGDVCNLRLEFDQTVDSPIVSLDPNSTSYLDYRYFGGIGNPGAAGATGDITLTTADLDSGDEVTLIIQVRK